MGAQLKLVCPAVSVHDDCVSIAVLEVVDECFGVLILVFVIDSIVVEDEELLSDEVEVEVEVDAEDLRLIDNRHIVFPTQLVPDGQQ